MITRRKLTLGGTAAATLCMTGGFARAQAKPIELKVSHYLPPNHTIQKMLVGWAEEVDTLSKGRLKMRIYPAGQLGGGANRQFDSCRNGVTDIAVSLHGATPGRYATTELVGLPFTAPSEGELSGIASKRMTELAPTYLAKEHEGVKILWLSLALPVKIQSKVPIRKIEDFKGLKVRYAGVQCRNFLEALGAVPLPVPPPETQDALLKGIIDAAAFPYEGAASFGLEIAARYNIEPGVASNSFAAVMNPAKYNSLPADLRALIDKTVGPQAAEKCGKLFDQAEIEGKQKFISKGIEIIVLPPDEVARMKKLFAPQIEAAIVDVEKQGKPGRKFYADYTK